MKAKYLWGAVVLAVAGGGAYWWHRPAKEPTTEEAYARLGIPPQELPQVFSRLNEFENKMSAENADWIAARVPDSLYLGSGAFRLLSLTDVDCTEKDFRALLAAIPLEEVGSRESAVTNFAMWNTLIQRPNVCKAVRQFLSARAPDVDPRVTLVYQTECTSLEKSANEYKPMTADEQKALAEVRRYFAVAPHCVGTAQGIRQFKDRLAREATARRGEFWTARVVEFIHRGGSRPTEVGGFDRDPNESFRTKREDGWDEDFHVRYGTNEVGLVSAGPDRTFNTNDDILLPMQPL